MELTYKEGLEGNYCCRSGLTERAFMPAVARVWLRDGQRKVLSPLVPLGAPIPVKELLEDEDRISEDGSALEATGVNESRFLLFWFWRSVEVDEQADSFRFQSVQAFCDFAKHEAE